jgi:hypothetical protein
VRWKEELKDPPFVRIYFVSVFIRTSRDKEKRREESRVFVAVQDFVTSVHAFLLIQRVFFLALESLCVL